MKIGALSSRLTVWNWALLAVALTLAWQTVTVHANYAGNWTGLFRTGQTIPVPERLAATTYRSRHPIGYDGQFYRFLAHDPFLRQGTAAYFDEPLLRARRILVPLLAWMLAGGQDALIDGAYVLVIAAFLFGGVYWLGCIMESQGRHAALGLLFLIVPAALVAIDSMTVDVALAALTACFAWQLSTERTRGLWITLAAAGLVRETGVLLVAACVLSALFRRDWRKAAWWASAALPTLCWYAYLTGVLPPADTTLNVAIPSWVIPEFQIGILLRALEPTTYDLPSPLNRIASALDWLALVATMAATVMAALRLRKMPPGALRVALALQVAFVLAMTQRDFWLTTYSYSRPLGPLFVLLLAGCGIGTPRGSLAWAAVLPALVDLRIAAEFQSQVLGVLRRLVGAF